MILQNLLLEIVRYRLTFLQSPFNLFQTLNLFLDRQNRLIRIQPHFFLVIRLVKLCYFFIEKILKTHLLKPIVQVLSQHTTVIADLFHIFVLLLKAHELLNIKCFCFLSSCFFLFFAGVGLLIRVVDIVLGLHLGSLKFLLLEPYFFVFYDCFYSFDYDFHVNLSLYWSENGKSVALKPASDSFLKPVNQH